MTSINTIPIWHVDAFADRPFTGNPAAVCLLDRFPSDRWMQNVAAEMNLSETSFLVPTEDPNSFHLRWFSPTTEVDLCGHATLAAAHTLLEQNRVPKESPIKFQTRSGELLCHLSGTRITLDFPATPAINDVDPTVAKGLCVSLGIQNAEVLRSKFDMVVIVSDARVVESLSPDLNALMQFETRGVMVTAASSAPGVDFLSRFFAPRFGINEDPVTGSAHCCLGPLWASRLGKTSLVGYQASPRGGTVHCEVIGDRVQLTGSAVTVLEGTLKCPMTDSA